MHNGVDQRRWREFLEAAPRQIAANPTIQVAQALNDRLAVETQHPVPARVLGEAHGGLEIGGALSHECNRCPRTFDRVVRDDGPRKNAPVGADCAPPHGPFSAEPVHLEDVLDGANRTHPCHPSDGATG